MTQDGDSRRLERLRQVPLFANVSEQALRDVLDAMNDFSAPAGQVLIQPGREGAGLFVIEEGSVVVSLRGKELTLGAGEFFGELALLNPDHLRTARVQAKTDVSGIAVARDDFVALLHRDPAIAVAMLETLSRRLTSATK